VWFTPPVSLRSYQSSGACLWAPRLVFFSLSIPTFPGPFFSSESRFYSDHICFISFVTSFDPFLVVFYTFFSLDLCLYLFHWCASRFARQVCFLTYKPLHYYHMIFYIFAKTEIPFIFDAHIYIYSVIIVNLFSFSLLFFYSCKTPVVYNCYVTRYVLSWIIGSYHISIIIIRPKKNPLLCAHSFRYTRCSYILSFYYIKRTTVVISSSFLWVLLLLFSDRMLFFFLCLSLGVDALYVLLCSLSIWHNELYLVLNAGLLF